MPPVGLTGQVNDKKIDILSSLDIAKSSVFLLPFQSFCLLACLLACSELFFFFTVEWFEMETKGILIREHMDCPEEFYCKVKDKKKMALQH